MSWLENSPPQPTLDQKVVPPPTQPPELPIGLVPAPLFGEDGMAMMHISTPVPAKPVHIAECGGGTAKSYSATSSFAPLFTPSEQRGLQVFLDGIGSEGFGFDMVAESPQNSFFSNDMTALGMGMGMGVGAGMLGTLEDFIP
ncbi:hypothetical protein EV182_003274, partial [Spiromyces aspiralis]